MSVQWNAGPVNFANRVSPPGQQLHREGLAHLKLGRCLESVDALAKAADLLKGDPEVWAHLGLALVGINQSSKAQDCLLRSLSLAPDQPGLWSNYGAILLHCGEPEKALHACQQALSRRPDLLPARKNACLALYMLGRTGEAEALLPPSIDRSLLLGNALRDRGELEGATEAFRQAILQLEKGGFGASAPDPNPFTLGAGRTTLLDAKARLDHAGIVFFLLAGTLLGVIREGDLLPHDKDLDIGVGWEVDRAQVIRTLCAGGLFTIPDSQGILPEDRPWYRSFCHAETGCTLDIFFLRPEGDSLLCGTDARPVPILCRVKAFGLRAWPWAGTTFQVPDPPEQYLSELYGADWKVPDLHYDTIISNPARTAEALPQVLCTGYFRLFEALAMGRTGKARTLAAQIHRRKPDPFLASLVERLGGPAKVAGTA